MSEKHQKVAKKVRHTLVGNWLKEVLEESGCTVTRLNNLRLTRLNTSLWPCPKCKSNCERFYFISTLIFVINVTILVGEEGPVCEHSPLFVPPTTSPYDFCPKGK